MTPRDDFTGVTFGKLKAVRFVGSKSDGKYRYAWECLCACGGVKEVLTGHLKSGAITDCGCGKRSRGGLSKESWYQTWSNMVDRCTNPKNEHFKNYGARGIFISPDWMDPHVFIRDMGEKPKGLTLERVNNDGPYCKENCVWADRTTQANNKRNVPLIELNGEEKSVAQWARVYKLPAETLRSRLKAGWSPAIAVTGIPAWR